MARNQDAMARRDTATFATDSFDPTTLFLQARAERDAYVGSLILGMIDGVWNKALRPMIEFVSRRRAVTEIRSLDNHMLADIGIDRIALDKGLIQRHPGSDLPGAGPAMWPRRPEIHSVPLSDVTPGASANDARSRASRVA